MEGLNRVISRARESSTLKDFHFCDSIHITHILFVNDILLFMDGSHRKFLKLKSLLGLFSEATGMKCNPRKSSVSFMNLDIVYTNCISRHFDFETYDLSQGLKYLGFHISPNDYNKKY